ncbi:tetratricopeptide (TPR) repeat protein [Nocardioides thalensis]|uniref:Tetratricopeptide (TPR) repeat protein n=1 Tax=Nocardioides thalensis TaxID=1914755 RepID=A0A853C0Q6_9ACTN|nr:tetratricopeptide repeat protein [Nocardioides thalensis]NYJ00959.1 tetratricopeptide (TPR) repeat protein [Nocardioides thalensis]
MAEQRRGKPNERGGKPARGRAPQGDGRSTGRPERGKSSRDGRPERGGKPGQRDGKPGQRGGKPAQRRAPGRDARERGEKGPRTKEQELYDGPPLPDDVTGSELAPDVRSQLRGLPEKLGMRVARHLAAAGRLIDDEPEVAYQHTLAARARAPRLAVVREAAGEAAYAAGHYAEALSELRAAKRINGATAYLPIMADCHRALGNAKRAIELAKSPSVARFPAAAKAEMTIVEAGARRDLGQFEAALRTLELAPLNSKSRESWVVRLRYAYADTLEQSGRTKDALTWFHRTNAIDADEITDAAERAAALERSAD